VWRAGERGSIAVCRSGGRPFVIYEVRVGQSGERRETKEEREKRHALKAAAIEAHRSKVKTHLSRQNAMKKLTGASSFHCPLKFDNRLVWSKDPFMGDWGHGVCECA
jgi:hypothetical protein